MTVAIRVECSRDDKFGPSLQMPHMEASSHDHGTSLSTAFAKLGKMPGQRSVLTALNTLDMPPVDRGQRRLPDGTLGACAGFNHRSLKTSLEALEIWPPNKHPNRERGQETYYTFTHLLWVAAWPCVG